ncbi:MAG: hypothetical protein M3548_14655 [Actinomycetota bacterium]|nr:hypothetical protein [Actinomycetota bacterium]
MRPKGALTALGIACAVVVGGAVLPGPAPEADDRVALRSVPASCVALRVHNPDGGLSTLTSVRLPDGATTRLRTLSHRVNAIGYSRRTNLAYGLASHGKAGAFQDGAHVVTLTSSGVLADLGPPRDLPEGKLMRATAGTVDGGLLRVRDGRALYNIDIDPDSPSYLGVVSQVRLWPSEFARTVDDFDLRPSDGLLYGVNTLPFLGRVVRINPRTGAVSHVLGPRLPGGHFGAVAVGPDNALYAATNSQAGRSRLFRVGFRETSTVTPVAVWPSVSSSDMTGCAGEITPPSTPGVPGVSPPVQPSVTPSSNPVSTPSFPSTPMLPVIKPPVMNVPPLPIVKPPKPPKPPWWPCPPGSWLPHPPRPPWIWPPWLCPKPPKPPVPPKPSVPKPPVTTTSPAPKPPVTTTPPPPRPPVPPAPPPPPVPRPPTVPVPPRATTRPVPIPAPPPAPVPNEVPTVVPPPPPPPPTQVVPVTERPRFDPPPRREQRAATSSRDATEKKRRWSLALLVMVIGAGAAMASRGRHR